MKRLIPFLFLLAGCGIKANPEVLKAPEVEIRRIGKKVYVKSLSGEVQIKGFERQGDYWVKEEERPFCFVVERVGEASKKFCVAGALEEKPSLKISEDEAHIELYPSNFEVYRLYDLRDGFLSLENTKTFRESIRLERDYWERCYAITGIRGNVESEPVEFCVKPKPPPIVPEVDGLEIREGKQALYLVWFYGQDYREFIIYRDGKEIGRTTGFAFETELPKEKTTFTVKVVSPLGFESKGRSVDYSP